MKEIGGEKVLSIYHFKCFFLAKLQVEDQKSHAEH